MTPQKSLEQMNADSRAALDNMWLCGCSIMVFLFVGILLAVAAPLAGLLVGVGGMGLSIYGMGHYGRAATDAYGPERPSWRLSDENKAKMDEMMAKSIDPAVGYWEIKK